MILPALMVRPCQARPPALVDGMTNAHDEDFSLEAELDETAGWDLDDADDDGGDPEDWQSSAWAD